MLNSVDVMLSMLIPHLQLSVSHCAILTSFVEWACLVFCVQMFQLIWKNWDAVLGGLEVMTLDIGRHVNSKLELYSKKHDDMLSPLGINVMVSCVV